MINLFNRQFNSASSYNFSFTEVLMTRRYLLNQYQLNHATLIEHISISLYEFGSGVSVIFQLGDNVITDAQRRTFVTRLCDIIEEETGYKVALQHSLLGDTLHMVLN